MKTCQTLWISACCGVVVLSAVSAYAGSGDNGIQLNGLSLNGMSQRGVGTSARHSASATQAFTASQAGTAATTIPKPIPLADPQLASTAAKRHQLTYLVRCALPADIELYVEHGTERFTFPGSMGLAPRWLYEAMTPSEER
jgi:hypothetical protein